MAEAAGLVIGGISLAGLFTVCVDCFEYVQLGRNFSSGYSRSVLKLDVARLRLTRWAATVSESPMHYAVPVASQEEARQVESLLGEIVLAFADAEQVSARYKAKGDEDQPTVFDNHIDLEPSIQSMHTKMQQLASKRQTRGTFAQKAAWALYDQKHFRRLIEDVSELITALVELFPAARQMQQQLCEEEATDLVAEPDSSVELLLDASEGVDNRLKESTQEAAARKGSHQFTQNRAFGDSRVLYGDEYNGPTPVVLGAGHLYNANESFGKAQVVYGNRYGCN